MRKYLGIAVAALMLCGAATGSAGTKAPTTRLAGSYDVMVISGVNTTLSNLPDFVNGYLAGAQAVNAAGGLKGQVKLNVTVCNHQGSAAGSADCARQAAQAQVDDVVQTGSFQSASRPIIQAAGIPEIGLSPTSPSDFTAKNAFPVASPFAAWEGAGIYYLAKQGAKSFASIGLALASSEGIVAQATAMVHKLNKRLTKGVIVPVGTTDWAPVVQQLKQGDPDVVYAVLEASNFIALVNTAKQLGFTPTWVEAALSVRPSALTGLPSDSKVYLGFALPPPTSTNIAGIKQFVKDETAAGFAGDRASNFTAAGELGWLSAWAMQKLSLRVKGAVTEKSMLAAAKTQRGINLLGLTTWNPGQPGPAAFPDEPAGTSYVYKVVNGVESLATPQAFDVWKILGIARK